MSTHSHHRGAPRLIGVGISAAICGAVIALVVSAATAEEETAAHADADRQGRAVTAAAPPPRFVRATRKDGVITGLETALVRYRDRNGRTVDLVAAVHFADAEHFDELDRQFARYDAVLYELVAPRGTRVPRGGGERGGPMAVVGDLMKALLGLESQLERVDYQVEQFVHADLSAEDLVERARAQGESLMSILLDVGASILRESNRRGQEGPEAGGDASAEQLLELLLEPNGSLELRRALAGMLVGSESGLGALGGTLSSLLIDERNRACMAVLEEQLRDGKRELAIYYGAGHMPDLGRRLAALGFQRVSQTWLPAWDMTGRKRELPPALRILDALMED